MTLAEAIEIVTARPGHRRYRDLCDPVHPSYNPDYVPVVMRLAAEDPAASPSLVRQALNFAGAVGRVAGAVTAGQDVLVPDEIHKARLAICLGCEHNSQRGRGGVLCVRCGCGGMKLRLATEHCPIGKWERFEATGDPT